MPALSLIHGNVAIYAFAFWLVSPVMPLLSKSMGLDVVTMGYLDSFFNLAQLVGGPVVGVLADKAGPTSVLALTQFAGGLSYLLAGLAPSLFFLAASKVPAALQHCMQAAQACIARDTPTASTRAKLFGQLSVSYGIGFVCGPMIGGVLAEQFGPAAVVLLAAALSLATAGVTYVLGTREAPATAAAPEPLSSSPATAVTSGGAVALLRKHAGLAALLLLMTLVSFSVTMFRSIFSVAGADHFKFGAGAIGRLLSAMGVVGMIINAVVIGPVTSKLHPRAVVSLCLSLMSAGFVAMSAATTELQFLAAFAPVLVSSTILRTVLMSFVTALVPEGETGTALGLAHASSSLAGVLAPSVAAHLFTSVGWSTFSLTISAGLLLALAGFEAMRALQLFPAAILSKSKKQ